MSPLILTPPVLQTTIKDIQVILDKDYKGYTVLTSDTNYYYKYASFTVLRNDSTLDLSIKFPITTLGKLFQTYKILSFPVEINSTNNHATQIFDLPDYFLITHDKQFHTTLTTDSLTNCLGDKIKHCSSRPLFKSTKTSSCVLDLFF